MLSVERSHRPDFEDFTVATSVLPLMSYSEHNASEIVIFFVASPTVNPILVCAVAVAVAMDAKMSHVIFAQYPWRAPSANIN